MKKMQAFFSWVPGRCREATEEGKKRLSAPLGEIRPADERPHPYPFLATRAVPVPQAGEGFIFVFSSVFSTIEMRGYLWVGGVSARQAASLLGPPSGVVTGSPSGGVTEPAKRRRCWTRQATSLLDPPSGVVAGPAKRRHYWTCQAASLLGPSSGAITHFVTS